MHFHCWGKSKNEKRRWLHHDFLLGKKKRESHTCPDYPQLCNFGTRSSMRACAARSASPFACTSGRSEFCLDRHVSPEKQREWIHECCDRLTIELDMTGDKTNFKRMKPPDHLLLILHFSTLRFELALGRLSTGAVPFNRHWKRAPRASVNLIHCVTSQHVCEHTWPNVKVRHRHVSCRP